MGISSLHGCPDTDALREPFTVQRLLDEPVLGAAEVLAGADGLERRISWCVPWSEAFRAESLEGVAVFAPADALRDESAASQVHELARRGACCLLVHGDARKSGRDLIDGGPELPVVQLPATAGYLSVSRAVAKHSLAQDARMLEYGVAVHRTLGELLYQGAGLPALARQLSKLSRCPAYILDFQGKVLASEQVGGTAGPEPAEVVELLRRRESLTAAVDADDAASAGPRMVELEAERGTIACILTPIVLGRVRYGWIVLVELATSPQERAEHRVIAEQAVTIVGSEMLRLRSVEEAEERTRGDFVHALLHGRFATPNDLVARASHHDFDVDASYGVVVARGFDGARAGEASDHMVLARQAQRVLPRRGTRTLTAMLGDLLVVIRQVAIGPGQGAATDGIEQIAKYAKALSTELSRGLGHRVPVTYGRPSSDAFTIPGSYREARVALGVCERIGLQDVSGYPELRVFAVLADIATTSQAKAFAKEVLTPLRRREGDSGRLDHAVLAYVEEGGNLNAAARRLGFHRNTMLYKLDRASRMLRMDLRQADSRFTVWLAYRIDLLDEAQSAIEREFQPGS